MNEYKMQLPVDKIYYVETLYNGKTSEQIFQEKLANGEIKYIGKKVKIKENQQYMETIRLGGSPMKTKLIKVDIILYDEYKDNTMYYHRNSIIVKSYTADEWIKLNEQTN